MTERPAPTGDRSTSSHDAEALEARATGDPGRIKALYDSYGKELWEEYGDRPEEVTQHGSRRVAEWQGSRLPGIAPDGVVLDVGCGPLPEASIQIAKSGRTVVCSDISFETVAFARHAANRLGSPAMGYVVADAEALPFRTGAFALVVADDVIEHVPSPQHLVEECARVASDEGLVSISTPNRRAISVLVDRARDLLRGRWGPPERYYLVPSHLIEFTRAELRALAEPLFSAVGFAAIGWDDEDLVKRVASRVTTTPGLRGLCRHWIVLARRPRR